MSTPKSMQQSIALRLSSASFLAFWCLIAAFPIFWIAVMSFKDPVDAFASNPLDVIFGPETVETGRGLSIVSIIVGVAVLYGTVQLALNTLPRLVKQYTPPELIVAGWIIGALAFAVAFVIVFFGILPPVLNGLNSVLGPLGAPILGLTAEHYRAVWVDNAFYENFTNSLIITAGVVTVSLTVGTLAGYGLARSGSGLAF